MLRPLLEERLRRFQDYLNDVGSKAPLDSPIVRWVIPSDRHLPQALLSRPLRDVLGLTYDRLLEFPHVGERRIEKLLDVLERVGKEPPAAALPHSALNGGTVAFASGSLDPVAIEDVDEHVWYAWCGLVCAHRLEHETLGRFAASLNELPFGLWTVPLRDYATRPLSAIREMPTHGPTRVRQILEVFSQVVQTIASSPLQGRLAVRLLHPFVRDAQHWAEQVLHEQTISSVDEIEKNFIGPLFRLLAIDLGEDSVNLIRRRVGVGGQKETLDLIATDIGLTRERVRQLVLKSVQVMRVRWPEGRYILDNVYSHFVAALDCEKQRELLHAVLDNCFAIEVPHAASRSEIIAAWDRVGRTKQTPLTASELRCWAANEFSSQSPESILNAIEQEGLGHSGADGEMLFFSNDPFDKLLQKLLQSGEPLPLDEVTDFLNEEERSVRGRMDRDPRFVEDEYKRYFPAEKCAIFRRGNRWMMRLSPTAACETGPIREAIAVDELIQLLIGGLLQIGISDATVWGVHRFAGKVLKQVFGAGLSDTVTPFILASMLTLHSDGLIRHMRRRRLRWDTTDSSIPVRGKKGWVDFVATKAGMPLTLDELAAALREVYQDYELYVLQQLNLDEAEEGEANYGCRFIPGVSNRVPGIVVPSGWTLNLATKNVSDEIRVIVTRIIAASTQRPYFKEHLRRLPWLVQLCEHEAFGQMRWNESHTMADADEMPDSTPSSPVVNQRLDGRDAGQDESSSAVKDLLSQFL